MSAHRPMVVTGAPTPPADFRNIVLRGQTVASYKFALAKSILTLAESGITAASLEELAIPFSRELCAHLPEVDSQTTCTPDDSVRPVAPNCGSADFAMDWA